MKRTIFCIATILIISSCRIDTAFIGSDYLHRSVPWDSLVGVYQMDKTSLEMISQPKESKWYISINKDTTYSINQYMDNQRNLYKKSYTKKIQLFNYVDPNTKKTKASYGFNYNEFSPDYTILGPDTIQQKKTIDFGLSFMESNHSKKFFILMSYFPDGSEYALKYEKISDEPVSLEELEKTNK